jgi:hypothetical protein
MTESPFPHKLILGSFRNLNHYSDIQGRAAARAFLAGGDAWKFTLHNNLRRNRMGANRTKRLSLNLVVGEHFHNSGLTLSDAFTAPQVVENWKKLCKAGATLKVYEPAAPTEDPARQHGKLS